MSQVDEDLAQIAASDQTQKAFEALANNIATYYEILIKRGCRRSTRSS